MRRDCLRVGRRGSRDMMVVVVCRKAVKDFTASICTCSKMVIDTSPLTRGLKVAAPRLHGCLRETSLAQQSDVYYK